MLFHHLELVAYVVFDAVEKVQRLHELEEPSWKRSQGLEYLSFECYASCLEEEYRCVVSIAVDYTFEESWLEPVLNFVIKKNEFYQFCFLNLRYILLISKLHRLDLSMASTFPFCNLRMCHQE